MFNAKTWILKGVKILKSFCEKRSNGYKKQSRTRAVSVNLLKIHSFTHKWLERERERARDGGRLQVEKGGLS